MRGAVAGMFIALSFLLAGTPYLRAAEIAVTEFGAVPDDANDDTGAIRAAIEACRAQPGAHLVFAPGRYHLSGGPDRRPSLLFHGIEDLTIDGNGAELVGTDLATALHFVDCRNVTIRNLVIDWDPLPFSAGTVVAVDGMRFDVEVVPPHTAGAGRRVEAILAYDPERGRLAHRGLDAYQLGFQERTDLVRPNVMRVPAGHPGAVPAVGTSVVVRHQVYSFNAFAFYQCEGVLIEDVTIYACPGMGVYADGSRDLTLRRFNVKIRPGSGRWMSATADATHFNNCRGTVTLEDCLFEGMGDDATNIHSMYMVVTERVDAHTVRLARGRHPRRMPPIPRPGDRLEFGGGDNPLVPYVTAIVETATPNPEAGVATIRLTKPLPDRTAKEDVVGNASTCPAARILRCTVRRNRARGMLIQTRDVLLEDCVFEDVSGAALHICADANYWWEGVGVRDVIIRGNRFSRCHFGAARRAAVIDIFAEVGRNLAGPGVHRSILIENNIVEDSDGAAIHVGSAEGVVIRGNIFSHPVDAAIVLRNCRNVEITDNKLTGDAAGVHIRDGCDPATVWIGPNDGFPQ